ncbi:MAG: class I SAM-dependent methyltransferase [Kiritimatiellae bacterium]|nr:class I SAM-dependent methyltransferase [Kiritimatiellia bacterium]
MNRWKKIGLLWKWRRQVRETLSTQLSLLEGDHSADALGGLTAEEEAEVVRLVQSVNREPGAIVEFGTLFGLTTLAMAKNKSPSQRCVTVDNFCWNPLGLPPDMHRDFTRRILRNGGDGIELFDGTTEAFRETYHDLPIALLFLDADHSYEAVRSEIAWAKAHGVPVICGHDYQNPNPIFGVTRAVDEAFPHGVRHVGMVWSAIC